MLFMEVIPDYSENNTGIKRGQGVTPSLTLI
jgi:hypothetical protein